MATKSEQYGHITMSNDELEDRIAADLYELADRLGKDEKTKMVGSLLYKFMHQIREAYRTARLISEGI